MKNCELCKSPAQTFCESDQATLCWECDAKVHGANFLVARHSRSLLCNDCKSPTPWKASGTRLGHTVSVCDGCAGGGRERGEEESGGGNEDDLDTDAEEDEEDDADEYDEYEEDEDRDADGDDEGENQVVPWSSTPPPPAASSSSSEDDFSGTLSMFWRKRMRENSPDLPSLDDCFCSSSQQNSRSKLTAEAAEGEREEEEATFADSLRLLESRKGELERRLERDGSTSALRTVIFR